MKTLEKLMEGLEVIGPARGLDIQVSSVCYDSRLAEKGSLFVCVPGTRTDGRLFIHDAVARGAVAIVSQTEMDPGLETGFVRVRDSRSALAAIAANFFDRPASKLHLIGITGTNGKTTTSLLMESILRRGGLNPGVLGTLAYRWGKEEIAAPMTTPESLDLQALFYRMVNDGVSHVVMEVSSHALALGRIAGCEFKIGVFTNLSQDHLDFHSTMEDYFAAKKLLFSSYLNPRVSSAVINIDDEYGGRILENGSCRAAKAIGYSAGAAVDALRAKGAQPVFVENARFSPFGITAKVHTPLGPIRVDSPLLGKLNLYNILAAISAAVSLEIAPTAIEEGIRKLSRVDGRLERVPTPDRRGFQVVVDYAHTPDAMEKALACIREMTQKRLIAVFGCGGDRDRKKRPIMGRVAAEQADLVVITSDNPRSEPPEVILDQIEEGVKGSSTPLLTVAQMASAPKGYLRETDRRKAIELALAAGRPGDMIFIGGKGHETYQIIGASRQSFDDRLVVREYLGAMSQEPPVIGTVETLAADAGGRITSGDPGAGLGRVCTDTRGIEQGDCFIALFGENRDGHAFVADAVKKGAGAVIVSREVDLPPTSSAAVIMVSDTLFALGEIARRRRMRYDIPVIAVSGSNGKTSTKEMVAAILCRSRTVLKNTGNFNNLIGLPLTLLGLNGEHGAAVVEMGINVPGEMERLARIGAPTVAVITNIHSAHLEGLGSLARIMEEKGKLFESLAPDSVAVVNLDDPMISRFAERVKARKITFSITNAEADVSICSPVEVSEGKTTFRIKTGGMEIPVSLPVMGVHYARNALAATAAALSAGAEPEDVAAGLACVPRVAQRMRCVRLGDGTVLVDDTYNANPASMIAALEAVLGASSPDPFVAVLGEMFELGPESPRLHFEVGRAFGAAKPARLVALGDLGLELLRGARDAGLDSSRCFHASDHADAADYLKHFAPSGAWILVKGSRGMTMEKVVQKITDDRGLRD